MLAQCPCFERDPEVTVDGYADRGTVQHAVYEAWMKDQKTPLEDKLTILEKEGVKWAVDHTKMHVSDAWPLELEKRMVLLDNEFNVVTFGTGDAVNGTRMFDLKTGDYHDYAEQIGVYGLMQMDAIEADRIDFHVLFARHQKAYSITLVRDQVTRRFNAIRDAVLDPERQPKANPYCKWCRKVMVCKAVHKLITEVDPEQYQINDPEALSKALKTTRILEVWCRKVGEFGKAQALAGVIIPYFMLKQRNGAREVADVKTAYERVGLPPDDFLRLCSVPIGALEESIAGKEGISRSAAKKLLNERLGDALVRRPPTVHLAPTNYEEPTEK
jgi:hypothetical protein